jgi:RHS repeat-associated protein
VLSTDQQHVVWMSSVMEDQQDASGLLYRRNRYYNPSAGRFTQEDPIGLAGGLNTYGFANGDPVGYSDPYGLSPCSAIRGQMEQVAKDMAGRVSRYLKHYENGDADTGHLQQIEQRANTYDRLQRRYRQEKCEDDDDHDDWWKGGGSAAAAVRNQLGSLPGAQVRQSHGWKPRPSRRDAVEQSLLLSARYLVYFATGGLSDPSVQRSIYNGINELPTLIPFPVPVPVRSFP